MVVFEIFTTKWNSLIPTPNSFVEKRERERAQSLVEFRVQRPDLRFWAGIKGRLGRGYSRGRRFGKDIAVLKIEEDPPKRLGFYKPATYPRNRWMIKG